MATTIGPRDLQETGIARTLPIQSHRWSINMAIFLGAVVVVLTIILIIFYIYITWWKPKRHNELRVVDVPEFPDPSDPDSPVFKAPRNTHYVVQYMHS